jgi:hypothetical protein
MELFFSEKAAGTYHKHKNGGCNKRQKVVLCTVWQ